MTVPFMMAASTGAQVAGQALQGLEGYQQGRIEAVVAGQNADLERANAANARLDASLAEEAQRREARKSIGAAAAAASQSGAAGGGPGQGSIGASLKQSAQEAELDALNIRYGGETEAYGHLVNAANYKAEKKAALRRAKGAVISGLLGSASSALTGAANYGTYRAGQSVTAARARYSSPQYSYPSGVVGPR